MVAFVNLARARTPEAKRTREAGRLSPATKKIGGSGDLDGSGGGKAFSDPLALRARCAGETAPW